MATSQIALPAGRLRRRVRHRAATSRACATSPRVSLTTDNVFSDGWQTELGTVTGDTTNGYTCTLTCVL